MAEQQERSERQEPQPARGLDEKLFLTPLIRAGGIEKARELAKVRNLNSSVENGGKIENFGFSGYLTVSTLHNSNLFFWFFPAKVDSDTAPVLLWINGGPGTSSMLGLFTVNGPFFVDVVGQLQPRPWTWTTNHSIVYIDSPVGTGFSFTDSEDGYCVTLDQVMTDLLEALRQFFHLFPEYQPRDFYIAGQSYVGKYAPALAYKIHQENEKAAAAHLKLNLKGFVVGCGMFDPLIQCDYGEYLYNIGLIDVREKAVFDDAYATVCALIGEEEWQEAHDILQKLIIGFPRPVVARFETVTGYTFKYNYLHQDMPPEYTTHVPFLRSDHVRQAIHVGDTEFPVAEVKVYSLLSHDFPRSVKPLVEQLLGYGKYRLLFYAAQFDVIVPQTGIDRFIRSLQWAGRTKFEETPRKVWRHVHGNVSNQVAGYVKQMNNLTHVLCRNAGHLAPHDQPEACFDMITRFTRGLQF